MKNRTRRVLTPEERLLHKKHALHRTLAIDIAGIASSTVLVGIAIILHFLNNGGDRAWEWNGHKFVGTITSGAVSLGSAFIKGYLLSLKAHFKARELTVNPKKVGDRRLHKYMKLKNKISKLYDGAHVRVGIADSPDHDDDLEKERRGLADH